MNFCFECGEDVGELTQCSLCDNMCCPDHVYIVNNAIRCGTCANDRCHVCNNDDWPNRVCEKCEKLMCPSCPAITGCQTTWAICENCYDYKCRKCRGKLSRKYKYLVDEPELADLCKVCYKHKCSTCKRKMTRRDVEKAEYGDTCKDCE